MTDEEVFNLVAWRHVTDKQTGAMGVAIPVRGLRPPLSPVYFVDFGNDVEHIIFAWSTHITEPTWFDDLNWLMLRGREVRALVDYDHFVGEALERGVTLTVAQPDSLRVIGSWHVYDGAVTLANHQRERYFGRARAGRGRRHRMRPPKGAVTWPD